MNAKALFSRASMRALKRTQNGLIQSGVRHVGGFCIDREDGAAVRVAPDVLAMSVSQVLGAHLAGALVPLPACNDRFLIGSHH